MCPSSEVGWIVCFWCTYSILPLLSNQISRPRLCPATLWRLATPLLSNFGCQGFLNLFSSAKFYIICIHAISLLNQAHGQCLPGFLKLFLCRSLCVCVCVCVCVYVYACVRLCVCVRMFVCLCLSTPEVINNLKHDMNPIWLDKQVLQLLYGLVNGHGLCIDMCHGN